MRMPLASPHRAALTAIVVLALGGVAACSTSAPGAATGRVPDSHLSYDRTFDAALGAMTDQKLVIGTQDRLKGRIVGTHEGETLTATLQPMRDGTLRVNFAPQGDSPAAEALQQRVAAAYNARMSNLSLLGGFKGSGGDRGPTPCPSGPAFCP